MSRQNNEMRPYNEAITKRDWVGYAARELLLHRKNNPTSQNFNFALVTMEFAGRSLSVIGKSTGATKKIGTFSYSDPEGHSERIAIAYLINSAIKGKFGPFSKFKDSDMIDIENTKLNINVFAKFKDALDATRLRLFTERHPCTSGGETCCQRFLESLNLPNLNVFYAIADKDPSPFLEIDKATKLYEKVHDACIKYNALLKEKNNIDQAIARIMPAQSSNASAAAAPNAPPSSSASAAALAADPHLEKLRTRIGGITKELAELDQQIRNQYEIQSAVIAASAAIDDFDIPPYNLAAAAPPPAAAAASASASASANASANAMAMPGRDSAAADVKSAADKPMPQVPMTDLQRETNAQQRQNAAKRLKTVINSGAAAAAAAAAAASTLEGLDRNLAGLAASAEGLNPPARAGSKPGIKPSDAHPTFLPAAPNLNAAAIPKLSAPASASASAAAASNADVNTDKSKKRPRPQGGGSNDD